MQKRVTKAMILAGGLGKRLLPLTLERPKPLLEVLGKPLLFYALDHLAKVGVESVAINAFHLGKQVVSACPKEYKGLKIDVIEQGELLDTGGDIKNAESYLLDGDKPFLILNADAFLDPDLDSLIHQHFTKKNAATLLLKTVPNPDEYGAVESDANEEIIGIGKYFKDTNKPVVKRRMFLGVHICEPLVFDFLQKNRSASILEAYAKMRASGRTMGSLEHSSFFSDVGTPERLFDANMDSLKKIHGMHIDQHAKMDPSAELIGPVFVEKGAIIEENAKVGPNVIIGSGARIMSKAEICDSIILADATVLTGERVVRTIKGSTQKCVLD